ncbi:unnamed protein product [Hapterophycus canaliculatus]
MSNTLAPEAMDLNLGDLRRCDGKPFGGATVLFSGTFSVGEGLIPPVTLPHTAVVVPLQFTHTESTEVNRTTADTCALTGVTEFQHLIDFVYPDILTADPTVFADRDNLSPTNVSTDEMNDGILNLLPAETNIMSSSNNLIKADPNDISEVKSPEFLQSVDVTGVPPHNLALKVGCVVMFVRNVNFACGIVTGRKGVVCATPPRIVDVKMIAAGMPSVKYLALLSRSRSGDKA